MHRSIVPAALAPLLVVVASLSGCGRKDLRTWRADDHDQEQALTQVAPQGGVRPVGSPATSKADDDAALIDAAWVTKCSICHGVAGRGDGPNGAMVHAANLTDPLLQENRSDAQLTATIRGGKARMPAFPDLPENVVAGLVKRIRGMKGN